MDANILCTLLAKRIPAEQFRMNGGEVEFIDPEMNNKPAGSRGESPCDTPENRAIVADVIANYDALVAAYLTEQKAAAEAQAAQLAAKELAIITNLPSWAAVETAVEKIGNLLDAKAFLLKLSRVVYWLAKNRAD